MQFFVVERELYVDVLIYKLENSFNNNNNNEMKQILTHSLPTSVFEAFNWIKWSMQLTIEPCVNIIVKSQKEFLCYFSLPFD